MKKDLGDHPNDIGCGDYYRLHKRRGGGLCGRGLNWMVEIERFRLVWLYFSYLTPSRRITYNESLP